MEEVKLLGNKLSENFTNEELKEILEMIPSIKEEFFKLYNQKNQDAV